MSRPSSFCLFTNKTSLSAGFQESASRHSPWRLIVFFLILALGICGLGWWGYSNETAHLQQRQDEELRAIADFKAQQITEWLAERRGDAQAVFASRFTRMDFYRWLTTQDAASGQRLRERLKALQTYDSYVGIELLDSAGIPRLLVGSVRHAPAEATPVMLSTIAQATEPQLIDLHRDDENGPVLLAYILPVSLVDDRRRTHVGYLRLTIDPQKRLYPLIQSWPTTSATAETFIVRREGERFIYLNQLRHIANAALDFSLPLVGSDALAGKAAEGGEGSFEGRDYRGIKVLSYLRTVPGTPWRMVAKVDRDEVFEGVQNIARVAVVAIGLLLFSASLLLWMGWRRQQMAERLAFRRELERELAKEAQRSFEANKSLLEQAVAARTAQLAEINDRLRAFTYAASHDLKAPLRGINSFSTLLENRCCGKLEEEELRFLDHIRISATRMSELIDDLLAYAQQEQEVRVTEPVDLIDAVHQALNERQDEILQRGAQVLVDLPNVAVNADRSGLNQVLRNLVDNALKYAAQANPLLLEIGGDVMGDKCRVWIRDNGVGFDMAYHDKIFEVFRRLHSYSEIPGTGVGLALVKKAMEAMDGRIWAESAPDQGATFFLEMPLMQASRQQLVTDNVY